MDVLELIQVSIIVLISALIGGVYTKWVIKDEKDRKNKVE